MGLKVIAFGSAALLLPVVYAQQFGPGAGHNVSPPTWKCFESLCRYVPNPAEETHWGDWNKIESLVIFGDSYSSSDVLIDPQPPYHTSCNGPNYVDTLTSSLNESVLKTRDYAIPGSVVDYTLIPGMKDSSLTNNFVDQVATFKADLAKMDMRNLPAPESVYIVEFGINDINLSLDSFSASEASMIVDRYGSLIEDLYTIGATTIIFLAVPPLDRSPLVTSKGSQQISSWRNAVASFNAALTDKVAALGDEHGDMSLFQLNTTLLFDKVLEDPASSAYTKDLKDTESECAAYKDALFEKNTLPSEDYKSPECEWKVDEYFWLSGYHPTYPVHSAMAEEIALGLEHL